MPSHWLFSYGTLRQPEVQAQLFGRSVQAFDDALLGFKLERLRITDPAVVQVSGSAEHPILRRSAGPTPIRGSALLVTEMELAAADAYEVADYVRVQATLASGRSAFVYVSRNEATDGAAGED